MPKRPPAVAGTFYEGSMPRLRAQVQQCFDDSGVAPAAEPQPFLGAIVPHAGLMYSGHVAAALYRSIKLPRRLIVLCPNHTGMGSAVAINKRGSWATPLGDALIDEELADEIAAEASVVEEDSRAHAREHSLEVQLPFVQTLLSDFRFVPICMRVPSYQVCTEVGEAIARVARKHREAGAEVGILASSDMNHYESQQVTIQKDQRAIDQVLKLSPRGLWETVTSERISMCGYIPSTTMLIAAVQLGATKATLVKHATSGDINGDYEHVVGYAGMVVR